ncbi:MAG: hypothetical protein ABIK83_04615 [Candidatus Zixiibacteriota bacterium]
MEYELKFQPEHGIAKDTLPALKIRGSDSIIKVRYRERWRKRNRGNKYQFTNLSLELYDEQDREILAVHWDSTMPPEQPYQPHWHFSFNREGFQLKKLHIPLNNNWKRWSPDQLSQYKAWLMGLLKFASVELSRALR